MKLTKTPFPCGGELKGLAVALAMLAMTMAAHGLDMVTGDTACERVLRPDRWFLIYRQGGTITVNTAGTVDILLVGGGGGGGQNNSAKLQQGGGGGGGGGVLYTNSYAVTPGTYTVTIGAGGAIGQNGGNTTVFGLTAYGGGGGANYGGHPGNDGASGGGATSASSESQNGGSALYGAAGNLGNAGGGSVHLYGAGGGGGAGTVGNPIENPGTNYRIGIGGDGVSCDIVGTAIYYGGGGAGFRLGNYPTAGGKGGGGNNNGVTPEPGLDGFGGGGNGGARGGSGIMIVSFTPGVMSDIDSPDFTLTGGDEILPIWDETVHVFRQSGTLTVTGSGTVEMLAVGGGGGGGTFVGEKLYGAGGGGAGGFVHYTNVAVQAGTYQITVGAGGGPGTNGEDTVALGFRAFGGGAGGNTDLSVNHPGVDGGSGGGGAHRYSGTEWSEGGRAIYASFGNIGNDGGSSCHVYGSAGGGGAGAPGFSNSEDQSITSTPGVGGDGTNCFITGHEVWYAGGGAGTRYDNTRCVAGGKGGGGASGEPGVDGLGGGGSGGQRGGSGFVAIRYRKRTYVDEFKDATGGVKTHIPGYDIHTFTADGTFTMPCAGKVEVLMVGGGGGGGQNNADRLLNGGGGGGAGGVIITNLTLAAGPHAITIGSGGAVDANGGDTIAFNLTAFGGGCGARYRLSMTANDPPGYVGGSGASGGGSTYYYYYTNLIEGGTSPVIMEGTTAGGTAVHAMDGNLGHDGGWAIHPYGAGGGGGAGAPGGGTTGTSSSMPGAGGAGVPCSITGTEMYYGGGGAGYRKNAATAGGLGGGGACLADGTAQPGTDGLGGGGCGGQPGGSGVVIIRYKLPPKGTFIIFK